MTSFRKPPAHLDRDACGIGLVADAEGRSSRALVDSALVGLAGWRPVPTDDSLLGPAARRGAPEIGRAHV